jgi:FkbM family methyltransferase
MFLDASDYSLTPHLALDGFWEMWITNVFLDTVKEGMKVIEVGANMGYYTLLAASKVGKNGKVFAFEANPETLEILGKNIDVNGFLDWVTLSNRAVFSRSETLKFHKLKRHRGSSSMFGFSEPVLRKFTDESETIEVEGVSLDDYFRGQDIKIDLLKMDAEGSEPFIFEGAKGLLDSNPGITIICEFAPAMVSGSGKNPRIFLEELEHMGFPLRVIGKDSEITLKSIDELLTATSSELFLKRK